MLGKHHFRRHAVSILAVIFTVPAVAVGTGATAAPEGTDRAERPGERGRWTTAAPMALERQELYPEVVDGRIYVAGGLLSPNTGLSAHFDTYDPGTDSWNQLATLPEARHHITLAAQDGRIYGVGGFSGGFPNWRAQPETFVYDVAANRWTRGVDLPVPRAEGVSESADGRIFYIGGRVPAHPDAQTFNEHTDTTRNDVFDPATNTWTTGAPAPTARNSAASAVIDGDVYVVGGRQFSLNPDGTNAQVNVPTLEVYDPETDTWETRAPMPEARGGLAATSYRGKLYVFGGEQWVPEHRVFDDAWVYDPRRDAWQSLPPLMTPRHGLGAATVGDRIYTVGGGTQTGGNFATDLNEVFVPRRGR